MKMILITCEVDDGYFTVGEEYEINSIHPMFVYAFDNNGNSEAVYNYQFNRVDNTGSY